MKTLDHLVERLCYIGVELSAQKNVEALLELILKESMSIANCDGGSIYVIEGEEDNRHLAFKFAENKTVDFPFVKFEMPIDRNSIVGSCVLEKKAFNFSRMDQVVEKLGFKHNASFDESTGYDTRNMLVLPLKNYEGDVIGVLQMINKMEAVFENQWTDEKPDVIPFTHADEQIISALASQVAILMERTLLFQAIENLLDSTIVALVKALDQRDPITAGHSERVADYAKNLYQYVRNQESGRYDAGEFSDEGEREIYIAGLLHDVGKIGVPEKLLMKQCKLGEVEIDAISSRFKYVNLLLKIKSDSKGLTAEEQTLKSTLMSDFERLMGINKSGFLADEDETWLNAFSKIQIADLEGGSVSLLDQREYEQLIIKTGNLTGSERQIINDHAQTSFEILKGIQWTKDLKHIPEVAAQHHEKLNGKGYPDGLAENNISLAARMIAIADIFDALTAKDRPYKPAIPVLKSLAILDEEAERGTLDPHLVVDFSQWIRENRMI